MAGFPETGTYAEIGHSSYESCRSRFPVSVRDTQQGPGPLKKGGVIDLAGYPAELKEMKTF
jgi:hypothetical protein